jgi:hypothetical protein
MESVEHIFLSCRFTHIIWRMVYFTNSIAAQTNITNMFIKWLNEINKTDRAIIHIGISALCWSIKDMHK